MHIDDMTSKAAHRQAGIGIIEILATIAILGLVAVIAIPQLTGARDSQDLAGQRAVLQSALEVAGDYYSGHFNEQGAGSYTGLDSYQDGTAAAQSRPVLASKLDRKFTWVFPRLDADTQNMPDAWADGKLSDQAVGAGGGAESFTPSQTANQHRIAVLMAANNTVTMCNAGKSFVICASETEGKVGWGVSRQNAEVAAGKACSTSPGQAQGKADQQVVCTKPKVEIIMDAPADPEFSTTRTATVKVANYQGAITCRLNGSAVPCNPASGTVTTGPPGYSTAAFDVTLSSLAAGEHELAVSAVNDRGTSTDQVTFTTRAPEVQIAASPPPPGNDYSSSSATLAFTIKGTGTPSCTLSRNGGAATAVTCTRTGATVTGLGSTIRTEDMVFRVTMSNSAAPGGVSDTHSWRQARQMTADEQRRSGMSPIGYWSFPEGSGSSSVNVVAGAGRLGSMDVGGWTWSGGALNANTSAGRSMISDAVSPIALGGGLTILVRAGSLTGESTMPFITWRNGATIAKVVWRSDASANTLRPWIGVNGTTYDCPTVSAPSRTTAYWQVVTVPSSDLRARVMSYNDSGTRVSSTSTCTQPFTASFMSVDRVQVQTAQNVDELAVFNRVLTDTEIYQYIRLP